MNTPVAMNPAVTDPYKALTPSQRDALLSIDHYRHQRKQGPEILIGRRRFKASTIEALARHGLIRSDGRNYGTTLAGELAIDKLKGGRQ